MGYLKLQWWVPQLQWWYFNRSYCLLGIQRSFITGGRVASRFNDLSSSGSRSVSSCIHACVVTITSSVPSWLNPMGSVTEAICPPTRRGHSGITPETFRYWADASGTDPSS